MHCWIGGPVSQYVRLFGFSFAALLAATIVGAAQAVTIATVPVGYAGNPPDTQLMNDGTTGYGAVPYNYRIGTYDVTNAQYVEFLNAKATSADPYGLWNSNMDPNVFDPRVGIREGAIVRTGSGPYMYSVRPGYSNKAVVYVSWYDAIRLVNWLQNGKGSGDTESGTYTITNGGNNSGTVAVPDATQRATWAATNSFHWLLPSEHEWYKAAYYNATVGAYYTYPFQSNSAPTAEPPPGNTNSGDFFYDGVPAGVPAYNYDGNQSFLTDVGAYPNSLSPFDSFDMGGDVAQWNETLIGSSRGVRGDSWYYESVLSASSFRFDGDPSIETYALGFRVASVGSVPEPSTGLLAALACGVIWSLRRRFRFA
jgi:formylglycine-generating enzyme